MQKADGRYTKRSQPKTLLSVLYDGIKLEKLLGKSKKGKASLPSGIWAVVTWLEFVEKASVAL